MAYQYDRQYDSPNFTKANRGKGDIDFIVIHHWGKFGQKYHSVIRYLCREGGGSSAHYVVEGRKVACIVSVKNIAWHAGVFSANKRSIGIECRPEKSAEDFETTAELIADLYEVYGDVPLKPHKEFVPTACPGRWEKSLGDLRKRAREILACRDKTETPKLTKPKPKPVKSKLKVYLKKGNTGRDVLRLQRYFAKHYPAYRHNVSVGKGRLISTDSIYGAQTEAWVKEFQRRTKLPITGLVDSATRTKLAQLGLVIGK